MTRYPYHRYLRYLVLEGDEVVDICRHFVELGYAPPHKQDVEMLVSSLRDGRVIDDAWRAHCDVAMFDDRGTDLEDCFWVVENGAVRDVVERALLDNVTQRHCSTMVSMRFGRRVTEKSIGIFRSCFWDTESLTRLDFAGYLARKNRSLDPPPGVSLAHRGSFRAWEQGVTPDDEELSSDAIMRAIQVDAFMAYNQAKTVPGAQSQDEARKWATIAVRVSQMRRPKVVSDKGQKDLPALKAQVYYPDRDSPTLADLEDEDDPI